MNTTNVWSRTTFPPTTRQQQATSWGSNRDFVSFSCLRPTILLGGERHRQSHPHIHLCPGTTFGSNFSVNQPPIILEGKRADEGTTSGDPVPPTWTFTGLSKWTTSHRERGWFGRTHKRDVFPRRNTPFASDSVRGQFPLEPHPLVYDSVRGLPSTACRGS